MMDSNTTVPTAQPAPERSPGWFKIIRNPDLPTLMRKHPKAFTLALIIAYRAWWRSDVNPLGLQFGEAAIDYENWGLTRQEFRTAVKFLQKWGFATFRTTSEGTVGKLIDTRLFEVVASLPNHHANQHPNQPPTSGQPAGQPVTKNERTKEPKSEIRTRRLCEGIVDGKVTLDLAAASKSVSHKEDLERMCFEVLGKDEMVKWGSRWRSRIREKPGKLTRVLATVRSEQKEGKVVKNPGAYAEDLWKRFR